LILIFCSLQNAEGVAVGAAAAGAISTAFFNSKRTSRAAELESQLGGVQHAVDNAKLTLADTIKEYEGKMEKNEVALVSQYQGKLSELESQYKLQLQIKEAEDRDNFFHSKLANSMPTLFLGNIESGVVLGSALPDDNKEYFKTLKRKQRQSKKSEIEP
jgi:hypothetical protein